MMRMGFGVDYTIVVQGFERSYIGMIQPSTAGLRFAGLGLQAYVKLRTLNLKGVDAQTQVGYT